MLAESSTAPEALARLLEDRPVTAARWGLERIERLVAALGHPERSFEALHIAGTNGKGSTAAYTASVLQAAGRRTGLYTSPHLVDVRERFQVDGTWVDDETLETASRRVLGCSDAREATYFEVTTAVAFECFATLGVETAVIETGLGGRLDATAVVRPIATAITTISLDHTELLGGSLASVAREKAGIVKPGVPLSLGRIGAPALEVILERADELGAPVARLGIDALVERPRIDPVASSFDFISERWPDGLSLTTGLAGAHQVDNAALAVMMLSRALPDVSETALRSGIADARAPGRFERWTDGETTWVLDIAHNEEGLAALRAGLRATATPRPWVVVTAILSDKPWRDMVEALRVDTDAIILSQAVSSPASRRWDLLEVARTLSGPAEGLRTMPHLEEALATARELAGDGTVVVTGSAHTVGDARSMLGLA
ncbi:MAG: bifunctional folylpolyglutamate synthase/dihydrofolate synthase [Gemmatimonadetes bacterium]|nr:bifunctional folylpolyglutamate synthase/dihydrofolate synthase [Gemmatimonadota bacterium]